MPVDRDLAVKLLRDLVAIDSVNPKLVPGARGEAAAAEFLCRFLQERGIPAELEEAAPGRPNVVALLTPATAAANRSEKKSASLAILAHIDTVGAGDMPDPFTPQERDGRLYGRGALDIKSGVAAMCAAAVAARDAGAIQKPLLIATVVDEECDSIGTEALLKRYTAEAAIVIEPTDLRLTVAHKGYAWFEILTHGRAAHGSLPSEGRDAIRMMGRVLNILDALDRKLASLTPHPLLAYGSLHASVIHGGQELSSYPAECRLQLERRMLPEESAGEIEVELRGIVAGLSARDPDFRATVRGLGSRPAYEISPDAPIVRLVSNAIRKTLGSDAAEEFVGMAAWTDTALLAEAGIPGIVFGPSGRGLHGKEEYVELDSVVQCGEILLKAIRSACGH
ncbi:MAG TPA: M20/M25/M40 family metallo-hydrolase [Candidatus Dormibacteraeota bacterium]|nr:M20/M25/M40 family metallo-hydrolase [Candidatus Dormibacteraeota bacterium]